VLVFCILPSGSGGFCQKFLFKSKARADRRTRNRRRTAATEAERPRNRAQRNDRPRNTEDSRLITAVKNLFVVHFRFWAISRKSKGARRYPHAQPTPNRRNRSRTPPQSRHTNDSPRNTEYTRSLSL